MIGMDGFRAIGLFVTAVAAVAFVVLLVAVIAAWVANHASLIKVNPEFMNTWFAVSSKSHKNRRHFLLHVRGRKRGLVVLCESTLAWRERKRDLDLGMDQVIGYRGEGFDDQS